MVESTSPVIRGYVNASDLADSSISWLFSTTEPHGPIAAVTHIVTLASLAEKISKMWSLPAPIIPQLSVLPTHIQRALENFLNFLVDIVLSPSSFQCNCQKRHLASPETLRFKFARLIFGLLFNQIGHNCCNQ